MRFGVTRLSPPYWGYNINFAFWLLAIREQDGLVPYKFWDVAFGRGLRRQAKRYRREWAKYRRGVDLW